MIRSITSAEVNLKEGTQCNTEVTADQVERRVVATTNQVLCEELPAVDLSHLTPAEQEKAKVMLRRESEVFKKDSDGYGRIPDVQMNQFKRTTYLYCAHYIPARPTKFQLYSEIKISLPKQCGAHSKNNDGMRLRKLNKKTIPDRHLVPHMQDTLDNLGGKSWFRH
ncbi:Hypothetical predicted protein [Paramuricea clavata]|uniref:Uncharacterized protein n=1 Tax=Paramuricea clavata TaxID=317549 RepID=A0A7D9IQ73_PARCT|nr:Hypothetical predicted protein [Paramuricea clavata]